MDPYILPDRVVLALTIWGEARGEAVEGQVAVANVIRNRLKQAINTTPRWRDVCLAPLQFSCWNTNDPNRPVLESAVASIDAHTEPLDLRQALWIADGMIVGAVQDNTHGALNYLASWLFRTKPPKWTVNKPVLATIGSHVFLRA